MIKKAFTLIELLIIIAIIGVLVTLAIVALGQARANARDAKRVADIRQMQTALELYYNDNNRYPEEAEFQIGGQLISSSTGKVLMQEIPSAPIVADGDCDIYNYSYNVLNNGTDYEILFCIANNISGIPSGDLIAFSGGIKEAEKPFACGDLIRFNYMGDLVTYGSVLSPTTGRCWLDRDLGASSVCSAYNDSSCYGDFFQWGRLDDGHQLRNSSTFADLSLGSVPGHNFFIATVSSPHNWLSYIDNSLWQLPDLDNNPCPDGWRVPRSSELWLEVQGWDLRSHIGAFNSFLKLPTSGVRSSTGGLSLVGAHGVVWSSTANGLNANLLRWYSSSVDILVRARSRGFSVRCIYDNEN